MTSDGKKLKTSDSKEMFANYTVNTLVTITESSIIRAVPTDFLGLSTEIDFRLNTFLQNVTTYPRISQLLRNLKTASIRFGGTGCDKPGGASWDPDGTYSFGGAQWYYGTITQEFVDIVFNFLASIGWKALWQINLGSNNPTLYADEANYVYSKWGSRLIGITIGNEPEGYVANDIRTSYSYTDYKAEWEPYNTAVKALNTNIPLSGTDSYTYSWIEDFANDEHANLTYLSCHHYPTSAVGTGSSIPTIDNLLGSALMDKSKSTISNVVGLASRFGLQAIISETNSTSNSGKDGVSNVFASALWATDYIFTALELGVRSMNFHGFNVTVWYSVFQPTGIPNPIYYALLLFAQAAYDGNCVSSRTTSEYNIRSHAVVTSDGKLHVVIINKDLEKDSYTKVIPSSVYTSASAIFLTAPSASSTDVTLGGSAVDENEGTWVSGDPTIVPIVSGSGFISIPKASAVVITFS